MSRKKASAGPTARRVDMLDVLAGDLHRQRLGLEPRAAAHLARGGGLVFGQLLAHPRAFGGEHAAVEVADHPLERLVDLVALAPVDELERDRLALGAVQDRLDMLGRERRSTAASSEKPKCLARLASTCM